MKGGDMTGSSWVPIVIPIVAIITLGGWLAAVYRADSHPGWKGQPSAPLPSAFSMAVPSGQQPDIPRQGSAPAEEGTPGDTTEGAPVAASRAGGRARERQAGPEKGAGRQLT
jgi:hypothetical protein